MFIALRRFTLLTTILLERILYKRKHDRSTYGAVSTMIIGERKGMSRERGQFWLRCRAALRGRCWASHSAARKGPALLHLCSNAPQALVSLPR